ncbi:protein LSM14 homolog B isoform X2 [Toxorhynchites rutilus septentrionalis]|uniref:protein LSM14 homolog B isoform X2 n=1 Tax=Toxorhynchites rutilus septentrionalis TaxID=329112 RepID=UPI00247897C7|nr:protein LSM14 homolog B isoform X2 [Toxorhynchites rutilus septentrionalis]
MSCPMPEIGSCISLISKADIRYEGLLFTVDPDRCTIALARVKSYGTEDRETQFPIAPQNQCYDYILFRGSDIKDIRVINNNPVPNDPAIMQMHLPPSAQLPPMQNKMGQPGFQPQQAFMLPQMGPNAPGPMGGPPPGHQPMGQPYSSFGGLNNIGDLMGSGPGGTGGSRSTTPSNLMSRKSPTVDMGVQTNQHQQGGPQQNNNRDVNRNSGDGSGFERNNQRNRNNSQRNNNQRERRDSGKNDGQLKENFNKNIQRQGGGVNQNRGWNNNRGNNQNNGNNMRGRPRGRGGPAQGTSNHFRRKSATSSDTNNKKQPNNSNPNNKKPNNQKQGSGNRAKNTLKFENDYDFEQANSKFEELRSQLSKLKVGDEVKPEQLTSDGIDKKDDSGNETGAGEQEQEEEDISCYDKTKSFFDNISCEAIERAKGKQQRTDWRLERKLNTETFGVGSTRRGGYNRRGGYYNRGPNNYRGYNQYRGGNNYRGRSGNRNNQSNGIPHINNGRNQQQQQQQQPSLNQQQQPAVIEVAAGK